MIILYFYLCFYLRFFCENGSIHKTFLTYAFNLNQVCIFSVQADTGLIGGTKSHEFHVKSEIGEDRLSVCDKCGNAFNSELQQTTKPGNSDSKE